MTSPQVVRTSIDVHPHFCLKASQKLPRLHYTSRVDSACALNLVCQWAECITCLSTRIQEMAASSVWLAILAQGFSGPRDLIADYVLIFAVFCCFLLSFCCWSWLQLAPLLRALPIVELTLEQVAAMLSGVIGKPVPEIQAAGVVDMLHAAEVMGMLKDAPALSLLAKESKDASKRRKLEATSAASVEPLAGEPGASSAGTDPMDQLTDVNMDAGRRPAGEPGAVASGADPLVQPKDVEMVEPAESQKSWNMAETLGTSDAASSQAHPSQFRITLGSSTGMWSSFQENFKYQFGVAQTDMEVRLPGTCVARQATAISDAKAQDASVPVLEGRCSGTILLLRPT